MLCAVCSLSMCEDMKLGLKLTVRSKEVKDGSRMCDEQGSLVPGTDRVI